MLQIPLWKRVLIWGVVLIGLSYALPNAFYSRVETHNDAAALVEAGAAETGEIAADLGQWPAFLPSSLVNLGLDLRGGAHLLAEVQVADVYADRMDAFWPEVRDALRDARDTVGTIRRQDSPPDQLRVRISNPEEITRAVAIVRGLAQPIVSFTGVGQDDIEVSFEGADLIIELSEAEKQATDDRTLQQSLEIGRAHV